MLFGYKINLSQLLLSIFILQITSTQSWALTSKAGVNHLPTRSNPDSPGRTNTHSLIPQYGLHPYYVSGAAESTEGNVGNKTKMKKMKVRRERSCIFKL